jgi:hypothetical protein
VGVSTHDQVVGLRDCCRYLHRVGGLVLDDWATVVPAGAATCSISSLTRCLGLVVESRRERLQVGLRTLLISSNAVQRAIAEVPGDRFLRWVVVTPDMHRVHHSIVVRETNSNFGLNLPWWDRLFGTYRDQPEAGHNGMIIGIQQFREPGEQRLDRMLTQPFRGGDKEYPLGRREPA